MMALNASFRLRTMVPADAVAETAARETHPGYREPTFVNMEKRLVL
jgi:hypothetical protein